MDRMYSGCCRRLGLTDSDYPEEKVTSTVFVPNNRVHADPETSNSIPNNSSGNVTYKNTYGINPNNSPSQNLNNSKGNVPNNSSGQISNNSAKSPEKPPTSGDQKKEGAKRSRSPPWPLQLTQHDFVRPSDDVIKKVEEAWALIEKQKEGEMKRRQKVKQTDMQAEQQRLADRQGWKTIRVFVSSTFTDMHSEREILIKKVFPELREWCEERKFTMIDCDLRWGVPKDSTTRTTICTCLEEIDRCHEDNEQLPFFVSMLSDRYGWMPSDDEVPDDIKLKYEWVPGVSITHMEILHGAYRFNNPNAIFCLRDPSYLKDFQEDKKDRFVDKEAISQYHLKKLKEKIANKFPSQIYQYRCRVAGVDTSTGREKVNIVELESFAERVLEFLKEAIDKQYPDHHLAADLTQKQLELSAHYTTMKVKSDIFVGREKELAILVGFATECKTEDFRSPNLDAKELEELKKECEKFVVQESDARIACVLGQAGHGKSALLAKLASLLNQKGEKVLYHQIGSTAASQTDMNILNRILQHLNPELGDMDASKDDSKEEEKLRKLLAETLQATRAHGERKIIILDALDEMQDYNSSNYLWWLPPRFPPAVRVVVSCRVDRVQCTTRLEARQALFLDVGPLSEEGAKDLVTFYMQKYNKRLDDNQMTSLLRHASSRVPLWLSIACEELRVFGEFSTVSQKIKDMPDDLGQLIKEVMKRLIREDETKKMEKLLRILSCSKGGTPEREMTKLLGDPASGEEVPHVTWATLRRYLKPFTRIVVDETGPRVGFTHQLIYQAVEELLFDKEAASQELHTYLADYYEKHCSDETFLATDLPHHLTKSGLWKRLAEFYRTDVRSLKTSSQVRQQNLQAICCKKYIHKMPMMYSNVFICNVCQYRSKLLHPTPNQTKDLCAKCGVWVPFKQNAVEALLCQDHKPRGVAPNWARCFICQRMSLEKQFQKMYLCIFCSSGNRRNQCSQLLIEK